MPRVELYCTTDMHGVHHVIHLASNWSNKLRLGSTRTNSLQTGCFLTFGYNYLSSENCNHNKSRNLRSNEIISKRRGVQYVYYVMHKMHHGQNRVGNKNT